LKVGTDNLAALYDACKPAVFSLNGETVFNNAYHKAKEMDLDTFSTLFDPHSLRILECVSRVLLRKRGPSITDISKPTLGWTALDSSEQVTDVHSNIPN